MKSLTISVYRIPLAGLRIWSGIPVVRKIQSDDAIFGTEAAAKVYEISSSVADRVKAKHYWSASA